MAKATEIEGLSAEIAFAEAGALVVETRAAELLERSDGVLDTVAIDGVHDMRVATRRLRAALEVFAPCFPADLHRQLLTEVKAVADALGGRRDRDVAIEMLTGFSETIARPDRPGIRSLIGRCRTEQLEANKDLAPFVAPERIEKIRSSARALAAAARSSLPSSDPGGDGAGGDST